MRDVFALLLTSVSTLLLFFSQFLTLWTPLPLFHLALSKAKIRFWVLCAIFTFLLSLSFYKLFSISFSEVGYFLYFLILTFFLSLGVWRRWSLVRLGFWGGFVVSCFLVLLFLILNWAQIFDLESYFQFLVANGKDQLQMVLEKQQSMESRQELLLFVDQMKKGIEFFPKLIPSFLFIFSLIILGLNLLFIRWFKTQNNQRHWVGAFPRFKLPFFCVWFVIGSGALFFLNHYWLSLDLLFVVSLNLFFASAFVYLLQGLSILSFFVRRFSPLFRFGIYGLIFVFLQLMGVVLVGIGLADSWFDFRRLHPKKS